MKLNFMQCWNGAMALLGAHKEAILAIAGVFLFLPALLFAQFVDQPIVNGDENMDALAAIYSAYFNENYLSIIVSNLAMAIGSLAIVFSLAPSRDNTVAENLSAALAAFLFYLMANILSVLVILPGMILFVIPGLYLACRFILVPVVIAEEGERHPVALLKRSWAVTKDNGFSILFFLLIIVIVGAIAAGAVQILIGIVAGLFTGGLGWPFIENLVAAITNTALQLVVIAIYVSIYMELTSKQADVKGIVN
ncbi:hypothetical protein [Parasphingorhabdus sp.]|uniref:hypothetical protein n=1 Tax=Parasphingorhabdus sp. TaxID=2709688 RepID=UPI003266247F